MFISVYIFVLNIIFVGWVEFIVIYLFRVVFEILVDKKKIGNVNMIYF